MSNTAGTGPPREAPFLPASRQFARRCATARIDSSERRLHQRHHLVKDKVTAQYASLPRAFCSRLLPPGPWRPNMLETALHVTTPTTPPDNITRFAASVTALSRPARRTRHRSQHAATAAACIAFARRQAFSSYQPYHSRRRSFSLFTITMPRRHYGTLTRSRRYYPPPQKGSAGRPPHAFNRI